MYDSADTKTLPFTLLGSKLRPPLLREGLVFRPWLLDLLRTGSRRRLTLLSAPTGYGKTTLLAQWRESEE